VYSAWLDVDLIYRVASVKKIEVIMKLSKRKHNWIEKIECTT